MRRPFSRVSAALFAVALVFSFGGVLAAPAVDENATARAWLVEPTANYHNPLKPTAAGVGEGIAESCADPDVIYGQEGEKRWYLYCTTDPLNDTDKNSAGDFNFHHIPIFSSADLVHWRYLGDVGGLPPYAASGAGLWAPDVVYHPENGKYYVYYAVTDTTVTPDGGDFEIGVATSPTPWGPFTHAANPVVESHAADCCPGSHRAVIDPEVLRTAGADYIYYGSYFGGISVRVLSEDGFTSNPATQKNVAIANKFEGADVFKRGSYYYLTASATDCCRGPLTGYSVFVGRSLSPLGPFLDRDGRDMNDNESTVDVGTHPPAVPATDETGARAGGTPFLSMSAEQPNRFVGPGHNTVFQDFGGQWWTIYHAVNRPDPYFAGAVGFTKRPPMLDPVDWDNGWPVVRAYRYVSDRLMPGPAAQPGQHSTYTPRWLSNDQPGAKIAALSDEFNGTRLGSVRWTWVRKPASGYAVADGTFKWNTQDADLYVDSNNASVLTEPAPNANYMVETRVRLNVPDEGCCYNYRQAGLVIYANDDNFMKLVHVSIWNTRQTEWAKEVGPPTTIPAGYPRYGNSIVGPPEGPETDAVPEDPSQNPPEKYTYLRIVRRASLNQPDTYGGNEIFTAYTSIDGTHWRRGGTWTHRLDALGAENRERIGLVSMGGSGSQAKFDYVRVYYLAH